MKPELEQYAAEMRARYAPRNQGRRAWESRGRAQTVEPYESVPLERLPRWSLLAAANKARVATLTIEIWRRMRLVCPREGLYTDEQIETMRNARRLRRSGLSSLAAMRVAKCLRSTPVSQMVEAIGLLRRAGVIAKKRGRKPAFQAEPRARRRYR
jgi:hypothetical protein